jgi:predicted TIM-barrel fold metal-dependent hydrolase
VRAFGEPFIFSVDDHVLEPPNLWYDRLPAKDREAGPRLVADNEREFWVYEDVKVDSVGLAAQAGRNPEEWIERRPVPYAEMRESCYDPVARVQDMDLDGVLASMVFPSFPRFCGQTFLEAKDKALALKCVRVWNDWILDEWCASAPGRLVPIVIVPLWDAGLATAEVRRTAAKGARAVIFSENIARLGQPSIHDKDGYWDGFFATCADLHLPVCLHIGSSSGLIQTAADAPEMITVGIVPLRAQTTLFDLMLSALFVKHPTLKVVLSEGGIGWIPYVLEHIDQVWASRGGWVHSPMKEPPSSYFKDHVWGCFIDDKFGAQNIQHVGIDNVMIEVDYPHGDSTFPKSADTARKALEHLSAADQYKVLRGNAETLFRFTAHR